MHQAFKVSFCSLEMMWTHDQKHAIYLFWTFPFYPSLFTMTITFLTMSTTRTFGASSCRWDCFNAGSEKFTNESTR